MAQAGGWTFNSATVTGTTVHDLSGQFLHGTITGSAELAPGVYGNGLHCTGGALVVAIPDDSYPLITDSGLTLAAWVTLDDTTAAARCAMSIAGDSELKAALYASNASGNVEARIMGVTYSTSTSIRDGQPHHIMFALDMLTEPDRVRIIVDGVAVLDTTATTPLTYSGGATLNIGRNALTSGDQLDGVVDDARMWIDGLDSNYWATVIASEQIDNQLAIYGFDDGTAFDLSSYSHSLTPTSAADFGTGLYGGALVCDGTGPAATGNVNFPDCDRLYISTWVRLDTAPTGAAAPILAIDDEAGNPRLRVQVNTDRTVTAIWETIDFDTVSVTSTATLTVGAWTPFQVGMNPTAVDVMVGLASRVSTSTGNSIPYYEPVVDGLDTLYVGGDDTTGCAVTFDYLVFTKNFIQSPLNSYWTGAPTAGAHRPLNDAAGYYAFNEGSGSAAADQSPQGNDLTVSASGSWVTGKQGAALRTSGSSPGATDSSLSWPSSPQGWALSAWLNYTGSNSETRNVTMQAGSNPVAHIGREDGKAWWRLYGSTGTTDQIIFSSAIAPINSGEWTHIGGSCNGNTFQCFLNGKFVGSVPWTYGTMLTPTQLRIGTDNRGLSCTVDVDDLVLFATPLSAANMQWLYENPGGFYAAIDGRVETAQADQTASASGTVTITYTGEVEAAQADQTAAAAGILGYGAAVAATQASQTGAAIGVLGYVGETAATQSGQTVSAAGVLGYSGSVDALQVGDTAAITGEVVSLGFTGQVAATQASQAANAVGVLGYTGAAAAAQAGDAATAAGVLGYVGAVVAGQAAQTASITGETTQPAGEVTGSVAAIQGADAASVAGTVTVTITGVVAATQADQTAEIRDHTRLTERLHEGSTTRPFAGLTPRL